MLQINIPGFKQVNIAHVVFDYNGTIARDGVLIKGVRQNMDMYSDRVKFHVITADTFGFVKKELHDLNAVLSIIPEKNQAQAKQSYVCSLGPDHALCVGNGANDRLMLKTACIGIAVLQEEGLAVSSLMHADMVVRDILDVFGFFKTPERLIAGLRT
jgi:soluble P-type ATPase